MSNDQGSISHSPDYDAVIAGASLAGCATAIALGRAGARVAVVEKQPDPRAYKRMCSHFIQASAVPTLERLELLEPILAAGGLRSTVRAWTRWGWIEAPADQAGLAVNLRRERLDPLVRETAAATPGVDLMLGREARGLLHGGDAFTGLVACDPDGAETTLRAKLVVGADGRDSRVAELAEMTAKTKPHGRFAYGAYFEGPRPTAGDVTSMWMMDPQWAAAFPTDSGQVFYGAMPTKDRLPEFKRDPAAALVSFVAAVPEPPPILDSERVSPVLGKLDMTNRARVPVAPGLALVGDAALAVDPLYGVGCGWALQSAEWLANSVAPALRGGESLQRGLARYRRHHARELRGHAFTITDYATGRRFSRGERLFLEAAVRDPKVAATFDAIGTRRVKPGRTIARALPRAIAVNARHALSST